MADIVLKNVDGKEESYTNVDEVVLMTTDGEEAVYSYGEATTGTVALDLSEGDQTVTAEEGTLLSSLTIEKPETLVSENIVSGVSIAGVEGTAETGGTNVNADYSQDDPTQTDYIKERPFYDEDINLTWDGVVDGETSVVSGDFTYQRVSDKILTLEQLRYNFELGIFIKNKTSSENDNSMSIYLDKSEIEKFTQTENAYGYSFLESVLPYPIVVIFEDGATFDGVNFPLAGVYFQYGQNSVNYFWVDSLVGEKIVKLDSKYLPSNIATAEDIANATSNLVTKEDGKGLSTNDFTNEYKEKLDNMSESGGSSETTSVSWNDIEGKPFGEETEVDIVKKADFNFAFSSDYNSYAWMSNSSTIHFEIIENEKYFVEWDGETYECMGFTGSFGGISVIGIGNSYMLGAENTGEPFLVVYIISNGGNSIFTHETDASHSIKIYQKEIVTQIPEELIPQSIQADWDETDENALGYIKNKPVISADGTTVVQSDWNVEDSTNGAYIKNKPFGVNGLKKADAIITEQERTLECSKDSEGVYFWSYKGTLDVALDASAIDTKVIVVWDGTEYNCKFTYDSSIGVYAGNSHIYGIGDDTGEPFIMFSQNGVDYTVLMCTATGTDGATSNISFGVYKTQTNIIQIDKKFIPDDIGKKVSWNDLKDKPFYHSDILFEWDGDETGLSKGLFSTEFNHYKISDNPISYEQALGSTLYVNNGYSLTITEYNIYYETMGGVENAAIVLDDGEVVSVLIDNTYCDVGTYVALLSDDNNLIYPTKLVKENVRFKPIDLKYIAPHLPTYNEQVEVEILPEGEYTIEGGEYVFTPENIFNVGDTVYVTWDGTVYECVAQNVYNTYAGVGNLSELGIASNGEPFVIMCNSEGAMAGDMLDGSAHNVTFGIRALKNNIKKLSKDYIDTPDWECHDEKSTAFIANKPFDKFETGTVILPETGITLTDEDDIGMFAVLMYPIDYNCILLGKSYTVIFNGVEYTCPLSLSVASQDFMSIGNNSMVDPETYADTGEPFLLQFIKESSDDGDYSMLYAVSVSHDYATENGTDYTISIKLAEDIIVKIPEEYLPDTSSLPTVTADDNGKFLRVIDGAWAMVALTDVSEVGA